MKTIGFVLGMIAFASPAFAGRAETERVFVRDVECRTLESDPPQYTGDAEVRIRRTNRVVTMTFLVGPSEDIQDVCQQMQNAEGTTVTAIFNRDRMPTEPPTPTPRYVLHGFAHFTHAHIVDGSVFMDTQ